MSRETTCSHFPQTLNSRFQEEMGFPDTSPKFSVRDICFERFRRKTLKNKNRCYSWFVTEILNLVTTRFKETGVNEFIDLLRHLKDISDGRKFAKSINSTSKYYSEYKGSIFRTQETNSKLMKFLLKLLLIPASVALVVFIAEATHLIRIFQRERIMSSLNMDSTFPVVLKVTSNAVNFQYFQYYR